MASTLVTQQQQQQQQQQENVSQEYLQAIVLASNFSQNANFKPLNTIKSLLPIANVALIDRTIEWLSMNKVSEIFIVSDLSDKATIEDHFRVTTEEKKNGRQHFPQTVKIRQLFSANLETVGDALRFVDEQDVVKYDFVLCAGDVVSNCDLTACVNKHRARRKKDKLCIATICLARDGKGVREGKFGDSEVTVAIEPVSLKIVAFKESRGSAVKAQGPFTIDAALFSEHEEVEVETFARDLRVDICSPEVLMLFTDNFDYQSVRKDFVCGVLDERELGNQLHAHFIDLGREYCARANDVRSFGAIGRDLVRGYCYPQTVDGNCVFFDNTNRTTTSQQSSSTASSAPAAASFRKSNYKKIPGKGRFENSFADDNVTIASTARVESSCVFGQNTKVGANSRLCDAIVGQNCVIGENVSLINCVLFDGCVVEKNAKLSNALCGFNCIIRENAVIHSGCVIGSGCIIGKDFELAPNSRIGAVPQSSYDDGSDSDSDASSTMSEDSDGSHIDEADFEHIYGEEIAAKFSEQLNLGPDEKVLEKSVGKDGKGYRWTCSSFRVKSLVPGIIPSKRIYPTELKQQNNSNTSNTNNDDKVTMFQTTRMDVDLEANSEIDDDDDSDAKMNEEDKADDDSDSEAEEVHFHKEVSETFLRALRDDTIDENVTVELQGLKMAENRSFADIARYVLCAIFALSMPATKRCDKQFRKLFPDEFPKDANECLTRVTKHVKRYAPLLSKFLKSEDDQVECLLTLEEFCGEEGAFKECQGKHIASSFAKILHLLYDSDVLTESAVLAWADEKEGAEEKDLHFLKRAAPFVKWLREAESESEDDDDDESDD